MADEGQAGTAAGGEAPDFRPLYSQVKDLILRRMVSGRWRPGEALPSEQRLAVEFGVSQGTVRKALDEMAAQNLVVREQGRGTFVASHQNPRAQFHFLHIVSDSGAKEVPTSRILALREAAATREQSRRLGLAAGARVLRILRVRAIKGVPVILERIAAPAALLPGFDLPLGKEIPDELYVIYEQRFGVAVARAEESLKAVPADAADARHLGVAKGAALLEIDRIARSLDGTRVEWRLSRCNTAHHHYFSEIE